MGAHQSVGVVTGVMIYCCCSKSSSAANLSRYAKGMDWDDVIQNGLALGQHKEQLPVVTNSQPGIPSS